MGKNILTESQIITILKEVEKGRTVKDVYREYPVSDATYNQWKSSLEASLPHLGRRTAAGVSWESDAKRNIC